MRDVNLSLSKDKMTLRGCHPRHSSNHTRTSTKALWFHKVGHSTPSKVLFLSCQRVHIAHKGMGCQTLAILWWWRRPWQHFRSSIMEFGIIQTNPKQKHKNRYLLQLSNGAMWSIDSPLLLHIINYQ